MRPDSSLLQLARDIIRAAAFDLTTLKMTKAEEVSAVSRLEQELRAAVPEKESEIE